MTAESTDAQMTQDSNSPIDMDWLRECTDGDADAMKTLLDLYVNRTTTLITELDGAIATASAPDVKRIAHACVGSSGTCGVVAMVPHFKSLEKMGAEGKLEAAPAVLATVRREFQRTTAYIDSQGLR